MKLQIFLIFISTIRPSKLLEIYRDSTENGLIFIPFNTINLKENDKIFHYHFNVTALEKILTQQRMLDSYCSLNSSLVTPLEIEIEYNIKWNNYKPIDKNKTFNSISIEMELFYDKILNNYLEKLEFKQGNRCENMNRLTHYLNIMNNELNQLSNLNTTSIDEIISLNDVASEIEDFVKNSNVYMLPFSLNSLAENFFKHTKFNFYYENYMVILEFAIPIYRRANLFKIFVKPIIKRNVPYLIHTDIKYAVFYLNRPIFYTNDSFSSYCFHKMNELYCKRPKDEEQYACEKQMFSLNVRKRCLTRITRSNIITKINDTFYCSVFDPMILRINCNENEYLIRISNHSRILNENNCFINTSFFEFDPKKSVENYKMIISNTTNMYESMFFEMKTIGFWDFYFTLCYLFALALTYIITVFVGIYKWNKKLKNEENASSNSEQHAYATVDYYI